VFLKEKASAATAPFPTMKSIKLQVISTPQTMNNLNKIVLILWAIVVVASFGYALYMISAEGWDKGAENLFIPGIALMWFLFRFGMYRRMNKNNG
jgi:uncharacterized membrane protein